MSYYYVSFWIQASRSTRTLAFNSSVSSFSREVQTSETLGQQERRSRGLLLRRRIYFCHLLSSLAVLSVDQESNDTGAHSIFFRTGPGFNLLSSVFRRIIYFRCDQKSTKIFFPISSPKQSALKTSAVFPNFTWSSRYFHS